MTATTRTGERLPPAEVSWVWTIRDGLVWRGQAFADPRRPGGRPNG